MGANGQAEGQGRPTRATRGGVTRLIRARIADECAFRTTWRDNPMVNYEDRADLLPPEAVVGSEVLDRLRSGESDPLGRLDEIDEPRVTDQVSRAVIADFIASEAADQAPEPALLAEHDAAEFGYAFGELLLGGLSSAALDSDQISSEIVGTPQGAKELRLFGLVDLIDEVTPSFSTQLAARLTQRARRLPEAGALMGALEEALPLAWCVGFGTAVIMADHR